MGLGKTLLPLLFGGMTGRVVLVAAAGIAKISLKLQEFAVMSDGSLDPVTKFLILIHQFHLYHSFLETNGESPEIVFA